MQPSKRKLSEDVLSPCVCASTMCNPMQTNAFVCFITLMEKGKYCCSLIVDMKLKHVHFRRHINPVTVDVEDADKKMLVMKDLNVQYFPCKICGAKFPSYYFVHKHKKMWHAAQMQQEDLKMDQLQDADKC